MATIVYDETLNSSRWWIFERRNLLPKDVYQHWDDSTVLEVESAKLTSQIRSEVGTEQTPMPGQAYQSRQSRLLLPIVPD